MKKLVFLFLIPSILLNVLLVGVVLYQSLMGCAEIADGKMGVLSKDIQVGSFHNGQPVFTLPKGLKVRDASASGADWFEPYRFRIVITSDDNDLVDYNNGVQPVVEQDSEYYSSDVPNAH